MNGQVVDAVSGAGLSYAYVSAPSGSGQTDNNGMFFVDVLLGSIISASYPDHVAKSVTVSEANLGNGLTIALDRTPQAPSGGGGSPGVWGLV